MRKGPHIEVRDPGWTFRITWRGKTLVRWDWKRRLLQRVLPIPFSARHVEYSLLASTDDDIRPSERLLRLALQAVQRAADLRLEALDRRFAPDFPYPPSLWPGQHYRLLAALTEILQPRCVVEIGTGGGVAALTFKQHLPPDGQIVTFDLVPWQQHSASSLTPADFNDCRLVQYTDDLCDPATMRRHQALLGRADLILLDAAKDGTMEAAFLTNLRQVSFAKPPLLILDDIRTWTMLKIWREIHYPKLDLTSFGSWTGTGIVEWLNGA